MSESIHDATEAMRLARTIASDLLVYNREAVAEGLKHDDIFERLASEITEGQRHFDARVSEDLRGRHNFLERALVDVLIHRSTDLPAAGW